MSYTSLIKLSLVVILLELIGESKCLNETFAPIVTIKNGQIRGIVKDLDDGTQLYVYDGIPYAEPPINDLRFRKPVPKTNWDGIYNATKYRNSCIQPDKLEPDNNIPEESNHSEDCLFLSVWQPKNPLPNGKKRSVMIWLYGGGFETGTIFSLASDVRYLAVLGDVVVVAVNYRLGPWGFLYAGTDDATGNMGLYDQQLGMKWVQNNIEHFGGDPNSVTIFGESAGGMSVGAHVLSPLAAGLYKRAIIQSGAPNSYLGSESKEKSMAKTKYLATNLNCSTESGAAIVKCLKSKTSDQILHISKTARGNGQSFEPIWAEDLMPIEPLHALQTGKFNQNIDLMYGTVSDEGALFVESLFPALTPEDKNPSITVSKAKQYIELMFMIFKEKYGVSVAEFYTKGLTDTEKDKLRKAVGYGFGDYHIACPTVLFGRLFAMYNKANRAYAYRVTHPPTIPVFPLCHGWMGVCHGDDVLILFGFPIKLRGITFTEDDYKLSIDMIKAWSTFAKTGVPPSLGSAKWEEAIDRNVTTPYVRYMNLDPKDYKMVDNYYKDSCEGFWAKNFGINQ